MIIYKIGKPVTENVKFTCKRCGCEFEADKTEYSKEFYRNCLIYACECPNCGRLVYNEERDR